MYLVLKPNKSVVFGDTQADVAYQCGIRVDCNRTLVIDNTKYHSYESSFTDEEMKKDSVRCGLWLLRKNHGCVLFREVE